MPKKRSKIKLSIVVILTLIGLFLTFFSFVIPTTNTTFKGFINAINYGYDLNGGTLAVYKAYDEDLTGYELDTKIEQTVSNLNTSLSKFGFRVTKQGQTVRIEASLYDTKNVQSFLSSSQVDIFDLIASKKGITFNSDQSTYNAEGSIGGEYIKSCFYDNSKGLLEIEFNQEGKALFRNLTKVISEDTTKKLYMYIDGENVNSSGFSIESAVSSLKLTPSNIQSAKALEAQISALAKPIFLTKIISDEISAGLNAGAGVLLGNQMNLLSCALVIAMVLAFVFLCFRYRVLGALASLTILISIVLYSFLLQSIPLVTMDLSGLMGVLVCYLILLYGFISVFERIKSEYKSGKKILNSVTSGFRKNIFPILESYIILLIFCAVFYLVGGAVLSHFAVTLFVGLFVNYFVLFVVLRGLSNIYLPINSTKAKFYNLERESAKNEI